MSSKKNASTSANAALTKAADPQCTVKVGRRTSTTDLVAHVTVTFSSTKKSRQTFRFTCPVDGATKKGQNRG